MKIPFADLKSQYNSLKSTIDARIAGVLEHGQYIMGPEVYELEERLADYVGSKYCISTNSGTDALVVALKALGVKINYITDGDIAGALSVIGDKPKNDIYYSTGGGPEGVIVAAALSCYGGQIQGRLVLNDEEKLRAKKLGITDFNRKYNINDMVKGDVIFCATGVTSGELASGVKDLGNEFEVNTFALHKSQNTINSVKNIYNK